MGVGDKADAFVLAIVLILFAIITISLNQRLVGTRRSYETIGGRGFVAQVSKLGKMKTSYPTVSVIIFQILVIVVPLGLLIYSTFMLTDGNYSLSNLTLQHWIGERNTIYNHGEPGVLLNPKIYKTAWNSIKFPYIQPFSQLCWVLFSAMPSSKAGAPGFPSWSSSWPISRMSSRASPLAQFTLRCLPERWDRYPALYGTFALLVIVSVAKHLPYSSRSGVSAMMQVGRELEEAAQVAGANVWQRFRRIIFPLTSSGFISGFLLTFITTMRELSLIILLVTPATQLVGQPDHVLYRKWRRSDGERGHFDFDRHCCGWQLHHWTLQRRQS